MDESSELFAAITRFDCVDYEKSANLFLRYFPVELAQAALEIMRSQWQDREPFYYASSFLLDVGRGLIPRHLFSEEAAAQFIAALYDANLIAILRELLFRPKWFVRDNTLHTIGRLYLSEGRQLFDELFPWCLAHDPLLLRDLFFEYRWLKGNVLPLLVVASNHANFSIRWSTLRYLDTRGWKCEQSVKEPYAIILEHLAQDPHQLVRAEAQLLNRYAHAENAEPESQRLLQRELRQLKRKVLVWDAFEARFKSAQAAADDYTVAEVEAFVGQLAKQAP
jgi:hypothetical protein